MPVRLISLPGGEGGKDPGAGGGVLGFGVLQPDQRLGLRGRAQAARVTAGQIPQPGPHHRQRLPRTGRRGRLVAVHISGVTSIQRGTGTTTFAITETMLTRGADIVDAKMGACGYRGTTSPYPGKSRRVIHRNI